MATDRDSSAARFPAGVPDGLPIQGGVPGEGLGVAGELAGAERL